MLIEFIEDYVAEVTPTGYIIVTGAFKDVLDSVYPFVVKEIQKRLEQIEKSFDEDEKDVLKTNIHEYPIERDE